MPNSSKVFYDVPEQTIVLHVSVTLVLLPLMVLSVEIMNYRLGVVVLLAINTAIREGKAILME
jgi:hypothetical protein